MEHARGQPERTGLSWPTRWAEIPKVVPMPAIASRAPCVRGGSGQDAHVALPLIARAAGLRKRPAPLTAHSLVYPVDLTDTEPAPPAARSAYVVGTALGTAVLGSAPAHGVSDAEQAITEMYSTEYRSLVRMSVVLVGDVGIAEEVVQDCFIAMHSAWRRLRDADKAVNYLRRSVVNRSRSVLRRRMVAERHAPKHEPDMPSAEQGAITQLERSAVIAALRSLPPRQREAVVLRYFLDLSEEQVASSMRISRGAVKSHTARAKAALRSALEPER